MRQNVISLKKTARNAIRKFSFSFQNGRRLINVVQRTTENCTVQREKFSKVFDVFERVATLFVAQSVQ